MANVLVPFLILPLFSSASSHILCICIYEGITRSIDTKRTVHEIHSLCTYCQMSVRKFELVYFTACSTNKSNMAVKWYFPPAF